jgi:hypothetical protein
LLGPYTLRPGELITLGEHISFIFEGTQTDPDATIVSGGLNSVGMNAPAAPVQPVAPPPTQYTPSIPQPQYTPPPAPTPQYVPPLSPVPQYVPPLSPVPQYVPPPAAPTPQFAPSPQEYSGQSEIQPEAKKKSPVLLIVIILVLLLLVCGCIAGIFFYIDYNNLYCTLAPSLFSCP